MATATTTDFPLATADPYSDGGDGGSGSANAGGGVDDAAGAAGSSPGAVQISHGATVAIIVVVAVVGVLGISMAVLFYLAKKREWKVRESIRRSARKVVTALTPRRSEFPKSVKKSTGRSSRGRVRLDDVPPTPRLRPEDIEKGIAMSNIRPGPEGRAKKWTRK
ncbi:Uu.00g127970.m01.CDS01 [Anthostomella pinea]|uniref:Uu.00g127970.m01.CDS01 n=1 Tax=Anthostomella pinea TaxID=933095 RepID=A0AAI8VI94_9PEZI|nr:Uu.00g127970.m01.CDS01 [Anthostomella pinea]